jgi:hypothetical protein
MDAASNANTNVAAVAATTIHVTYVFITAGLLVDEFDLTALQY